MTKGKRPTRAGPKPARSRPHAPRRRTPAGRAADDVGLAAPELRWIYDTAPIGLAFLSPDCRYLQINQRLTDICGISVQDHLGHTVREMVPNIAGQVEQLVQSIVAKGEPVTDIEVSGQRADGVGADRCWLTSWYPLKDPGGYVLGVNVAAEEITERKRAQAALMASEQRYRALVLATSSLVWTATADGQFIEFARVVHLHRSVAGRSPRLAMVQRSASLRSRSRAGCLAEIGRHEITLRGRIPHPAE